MELVCRETRRPFSWFYDLGSGNYIRKDAKNAENARIYRKHLPDPLDILEARTKLKAKGLIPLDARVHADPVTKQLWEHAYAKSNNKFQS